MLWLALYLLVALGCFCLFKILWVQAPDDHTREFEEVDPTLLMILSAFVWPLGLPFFVLLIRVRNFEIKKRDH